MYVDDNYQFGTGCTKILMNANKIYYSLKKLIRYQESAYIRKLNSGVCLSEVITLVELIYI